MSTCPVCYQPVREGLIYCSACANQLIDAPFGDTLPVNPFRSVPSIPHFAPSSGKPALKMWIRTGKGLQVLPLPQKRLFTFGRLDADRGITPDIDLTCFAARELGVSCFHARIDSSTSVPTLIDLGSTNGTQLNGVRVKPYSVNRLHHNDMICLGRLILYVVL